MSAQFMKTGLECIKLSMEIPSAVCLSETFFMSAGPEMNAADIKRSIVQNKNFD